MIGQRHVSRGKGKAAKGDSPTQSSNPRCRRHPVVAAGLLIAAALGLGAAAPTAAAEGCTAFDTVAAADGVRTGLFAPGQFIVERADSQGPAAQATASSNGLSAAYAGAPYPGDAALSAVGLAGGDPSAIPTFVASQFPTQQEAERTTPGSSLKATSARTTSSGSASGGGGSGDQGSAGKTVSTAVAGCDDAGRISAKADTDSEAVSFAAGTLRMGRINSVATADVAADGKTVLASDLKTGQFTVVGQTVVLTEKGLVTPAGTTPLPGNPLAEALASAGLEVRYVASEMDPDGRGITAPGVQVRVTRDIGGTGPSVVTYTFGRARARATGENASAVGAVTSGGAFIPPDDGSGGGTNGPAFEGGSTGSADSGFGGGFEAPATAPDAVSQPSTDTTPVAADQDPATQPAVAARPVGIPLSLANIYLALVAGAVAVFGGGSLLRVIGVKLAWT